MGRLSEIGTLAACLAFTSVARADGADLKRAADDAFDAHRYDEAAQKYEESYAEKHDPSVLYNLARTYETLGKYPEALDRLHRFNDSAMFETRKKVPKLDSLLALYRSRVATLEVTSNVTGARVIVRNIIVGETAAEPKKFQVNAGSGTVEVSKDGYRTWKRVCALEGAQVTAVVANLEEKSAVSTAALTPATSDSPAPVTTSEPLYQRWYFWAGAGAVVVIAATIGIYAALTTERSPEPGSISPGILIVPRTVSWVSF